MELSGPDTLPQREHADTPELLGGRYLIDALLGAGGMGSVYRVRDIELDEVVALKIVGALDAPALARFRDEVKLARRVTHANVARTFDIGEHAGVRFLTMEYVPGESLRRLLARAQLDEADARFLAEAICDACIAIHDAAVIHGDLKPENIVVAPSGLVKVTDFGLAALRDHHRAYAGTPGYMAPEQDQGAPADQRADLFSLGVILHELFAGHRPAGGLSPELPGDVREVVARCLDPDPARRPGSTREVRAALAPRADPPRRLTAPIRAQPQPLTVAVRGLHAEEPGDAELAAALAGALTRALPIGGDDCDAIVEGTLRRTAPRLHLSLHLLSRREGYVMWARTTTIAETDAPAAIADAARAIANALDAKASPPQLRDPRLIERYLKASALDENMFHDHTADNVEMYRAMLEHAPGDPLIHAGYARSLVQRGLREVGALDDAAVACEQALAVAPELAEAHLSLALRLFIGNDSEGAVRAILRGIALAPSLPWGHSMFGRLLSEVGLLERGLARSELALSLEPDNAISWANVVRYADLAGRDERVAQLLAGPPPFARDGNHWMYWVTRAQRAVGKGWAEAEVVAAALAASPASQSPLLAPLVGALRGDLAAADLRAVFSPFLDGDPANHRARSCALGFGAELAIHLGYLAEARAYVEESVREGTCDVTWIDRCPSFESLRGEPWFVACRERVAARADRVRAAVPSE